MPSLLATLALAAPAIAQDEVIAPPGNSGVEEYLEVVPGAGGDKPANPSSGGGAAPRPAPAGRARRGQRRRRWKRSAPTGRPRPTAAASGSTTDRKTARERGKGGVLGDSATGKSITAQSSGDRVTGVARALGGDGGGMGLLFPILLGATLSLAVVVALGRRRRRA